MSQPQRPPEPPERAARSRSREALAAAAQASPTASATPPAAARAALAAHGRRARVPRARRPRHLPGDRNDSVLVAVAARIGDTRLIDNVLIERAATRIAGASTRKEPSVSSPPREPRFDREERKPVTLTQALRAARARRADRHGHRLRPSRAPWWPRTPGSTSSWSATRPPTTSSATATRCRSRSTSCSCSPRAVRRGLRTPLMVGDLPFGTYEASDEQAIATAHRFVKEAGCDAVKLEGGGPMAERARAIVKRRHAGDGPRRPHPADGDGARRLPRPGPHRRARRGRCSTTRSRSRRRAASRSSSRRSPPSVTDLIMAHMEIPVIGIGAGPSTDGQVLVLHDLLGIHDALKPKFVKRYADVCAAMVARRRGLRRGGAHARLPRPGARLRRRAGGDRAAAARCSRRSARARATTLNVVHTYTGRRWPACPSSSRRASASSTTCSRRPARNIVRAADCSSRCSSAGPTTASSPARS